MSDNNYINSFKNRCEKYLYAIQTYPKVMENEFKTAIEMLELDLKDINNNLSILNIPAAGIDIGSYLKDKKDNKDITYYTFETSPDFVKLDPKKYKLCSYNDIPLEDNSIDRVIVLASLHHVEPKDRENVYKEFNRILKKDGLLVIGDVIKDSVQDHFLNEFVNKWNSNGHSGIFFSEKEEESEDKNLLEKCNFNVDITTKKYNWIFKNDIEMKDFVLNLFGLDLYDNKKSPKDLKEDLSKYLTFNEEGFEWQLIYFTCRKIE